MTPAEAVATVNARFAERVRQLRQARGLSQRELGLLLDLTETQVRGMERIGSKRQVSIGEAAVLAQRLGVPLGLMLRAEPLPSAALMGPLPEVPRDR